MHCYHEECAVFRPRTIHRAFERCREAPLRAPTIGFVSLGCPKNLVDSEVMMGLLDRAGGTADRARRGRRDSGRQHMQLHRLGQAGVGERDPRNGAAQTRERRQGAAAHRRRMPRRAIPRRDSPQHSRGRCRPRHRRAGINPRSRRPDRSRRAYGDVSPFNILVSRAASAVQQHSHPTEVSAGINWQCPTSRSL